MIRIYKNVISVLMIVTVLASISAFAESRDVSKYDKSYAHVPDTSDLIVEINSGTIKLGENSVKITAKNSEDTDKVFNPILAVYENDTIVTVKVGESKTLKVGETMSFTETVVIPEEADLSNSRISVMAFENMNSITPVYDKINSNSVPFEFTLEEKSATSAGVYDADGKLVKTLWSNVSYEAGTYCGVWDGTDDCGNIVSDGNYTVNVTSNQIKYDFIGIMGNTSNPESLDTIIAGYGFISDMALGGTKMYYTKGYNEGTYCNQWFDISNPNEKAGVFGEDNKPAAYRMVSVKAATDGKYVYYGTEELDRGAVLPGNTIEGIESTLIYAYDINTGQPVTFEKGTMVDSPLWKGAIKNIYSALDIRVALSLKEDNHIGGMAVQKEGNLLFATYTDLGVLSVIDKTTGELLKEYSFDSPKDIDVDAEDNLWIVSDTGVEKYITDTDGSITLDHGMDYVFDKPLSVGISPDSKYIIVIDGGNTNKVLCFDYITEELIMSYGSGESYIESAEIKEDKLLFVHALKNNFSDIREYSYIEFESDNTFWFGNIGNNSAYKMNISDTELIKTDEISYLQSSYNCHVDKTDPTRVFSDGFEFEVDYTAGNMADFWEKRYNYNPQIFGENVGGIEKFFNTAATFPDGNVYCIVYDKDSGKNYLWYIDENRKVHKTTVEMGNKVIRSDLSLAEYTKDATYAYWKICNYEGIDGNGLPYWGDEQILAQVELSKNMPIPSIRWSVEPTDSGILPALRNPNSTSEMPEGLYFSLGGIDLNSASGSEYKWVTAPVTSKAYKGGYPTDGALDVGAGVWYTVSRSRTLGNHIIYQYHGEAYKGRVNKFTHYYHNGLLLSVYGLYRNEEDGKNAVIPGNAFSWNLIESPTDSSAAYILQNDESWGGGIHVSKISGLDTVKEEKINVSFASGMVKKINYTVYNKDISEVIERGSCESFSDVTLGVDRIIKFEGYYNADADKTYKFRTVSNGNVEFVINEITVISGTGTQNGSIDLSGGRNYKFTLWVKPNNGILSSLAVRYNSRGSLYTNLTASTGLVYAYVPKVNYGYEYNLIDNLPYDATFENMYGWTTDGATFRTNMFNYSRFDDRDITVSSSVEKGAEAVSERILPAALENISSWTIDSEVLLEGALNFGVYNDKSQSFGTYIDVLDINDMVIARVCFGNDFIVYGNDIPVYQANNLGTLSTKLFTDTEFVNKNNLMISGKDEKVIITYCGSTVYADVYEEGADWTAPKTLRLTSYNNLASSASFKYTFSKLKYYME